MLRKILATTAAVFVSTAALTAIDAGVSGASPQPAVGTVSCNVIGNGKFSPKLTLAGVTSTAVKFSFKEKANASTGGCAGSVMVPNSAGSLSPVTVHGVKISGAGYIQPIGPGNANACPVFTGQDTIGALTVKYVWNSTPNIAPSLVTYGVGAAPIVSGSPFDTISLQAAGSAVTGSGSFAPPVTAPNTMLTNIVSTCGSGWGPYAAFTIGAGSSIALP